MSTISKIKVGGTIYDIVRTLDYYPVGSIYLSVNSTSPAELFGGTWEQIKDKFLLSAGNKYTAGNTGGEESHAHKYGVKSGELWGVSLFANTHFTSGVLENGDGDGTSWKKVGDENAVVNASYVERLSNVKTSTYKSIADTSVTSNMPPYLAVYIWKRVS